MTETSPQPRYYQQATPSGHPHWLYTCRDCGGLIGNQLVHDRFHSILDAQARAIAVLVNAHIAQHAHDKWDVYDRIPRDHDNWSRDAFKEVAEAAGLPTGPALTAPEAGNG